MGLLATITLELVAIAGILFVIGLVSGTGLGTKHVTLLLGGIATTAVGILAWIGTEHLATVYTPTTAGIVTAILVAITIPTLARAYTYGQHIGTKIA